MRYSVLTLMGGGCCTPSHEAEKDWFNLRNTVDQSQLNEI